MAEASVCGVDWKLNPVEADGTYSGSCTFGEQGAVAMAKDYLAEVNFIWDAGSALIAVPGDRNLLKLYTNAAKTTYWSMTMICTRFKFAGNISEGGAIKCTYEFALSYLSGAVAPSYTGTGTGPLSATGVTIGWGT